MNAHEKMRKVLAAQEKARKAVEYKAGDSQRRSAAARNSAEVRREYRMEAILAGDIEPKTKAEVEAANRAMFEDAIAWGDDL